MNKDDCGAYSNLTKYYQVHKIGDLYVPMLDQLPNEYCTHPIKTLLNKEGTNITIIKVCPKQNLINI
jgi:hypothetical protein